MMIGVSQIVILAFLVGCTSATNVAEDELLQLCHHQSGLELTRVSQVLALIEQVKTVKETDCDKDIVESLLDLEPILSEGLNDVCTVEKSQQILQYHKRHVTLAKEERTGVKAPEALRKFFVALGFRISQICKKNMINSLILDAQPQLTQEDFDKLKVNSKSDQNILSILSSKPQDYDDIVLAGEVAQATGSDSQDARLLIQAPTGNMMKKIQVVCKRRFKPFYERLILPLILLSNIGYNYQGEELEREINELKSNNGVHTWYEIAFLCESVADIEVVETPLEDDADATGKHNIIKLFQGQEAEEMREKLQSQLDTISPELDAAAGPQIVYKPAGGNPIGDEVLDKRDKVFMKLVNKYDSQRGSLERVRSKIFWKATSLVREVLSRADITFVGSIFKSLRNNGNKMDLVEALDDHVREQTQGTQVDSAVSVGNPLNYAKRMYQNTVFYGPTGLLKKARKKDGGLTKSLFWKIVAVVMFAISIVVACSVG